MKFSVIIPTYNSAATLKILLDSLAKQTISDHEVIVVDDASNDDTATIAASYQVKYLRLETNQGPAAARNHGAREAAGQWFVFTDADTVFEPDTLQSIQKAVDASDAAALFGSYSGEPANSGFLPSYKALWDQYAIDMTLQKDQRDLYPSNSWLPRPGVVRREAFHAIGGFDTRFKGPDLEDMEFGYRLFDARYAIYYTPHIHILHHYPRDFFTEQSRFFRRCVLWMRMTLRRKRLDSYGDGSPILLQKHICGLVTFWLAVAGSLFKPLLALALIGLLLHTFLHRRFLSLAYRKRGLSFTALSFATYWFHTVSAGFAGGVGLLTFLLGNK
ncbi:MAG: glycosyltransferase family 2 protein [Deltaproteobacteria bacterium]|nr:glycosyltransferase family 2 protein [Deltaproteobacteria bacterium]